MKVYISSTYQDLIDHRAAVDRTLRRMGHDVIGMEQYIAEGSKPVDRCKADVRASGRLCDHRCLAIRVCTGPHRVATGWTIDNRNRTRRSAGKRQAGACLPARP